MDHAAYAELIAGRALGDLDRDEERTVEAHLPGCAACRSIARDMDVVLADLALAAPARPVPPLLGTRILRAIHEGSGPARPPLGGAPSRPSLRDLLGSRTRMRAWFAPAVGVVAIVAILALGVELVALRDQLEDAQRVARVAVSELAARDGAMAVMADPAHAAAWLEPSQAGITASALMVYLPGAPRAWLMANGLPATPEGSVYQFWYADAEGVHPGVSFAYDGAGTLLMPVQVDLRGAQAAMLTIESSGRSAGAPSQDIVFGDLPAS
jgi:hypothetical protein